MGDIAALRYRERPAAAEPEGLLLLFHGRGADENDLYPLFDILDPDRRLRGFAPRGPLSLPPGGAHWYVVKRVGHPDPETFWPTLEAVRAWLDGVEEATGFGMDRTIIGGFSQGAVMSYSVGLERGRTEPVGLIGLSGFIPTVEGFDLDLENRSRLQVAIGHGTYDPVIGVDFGRAARERLQAAGANVLYRESPMPHSIDPGFLRELRPWVKERIAAMPGATPPR
jgi:phospholipase/carboxylesterase